MLCSNLDIAVNIHYEIVGKNVNGVNCSNIATVILLRNLYYDYAVKLGIATH